jgi:hypothetical protein
MPSIQKNQRTLILILMPLIFAVLIMTPRLISAQFGMFDDGAILLNVQNILQGDLSMSNDQQAGRFRHFYWAYYTLIFSLVGMNPFWFYIGHLILLLILLTQIRLLMKNMGATPLQSLIASLVFLFSMPIIENFYTLSKGEPLQLIFLLAAILNFQKLNPEKAVWRAFLISLCLLSAIFVKETAITMAPLALFWLIYLFIWRKHIEKIEKQKAAIFLLTAAAAVGTYLVLRQIWGTASLTGGTYTERYSLTLQTILANSARWMTQLAFYFLYLIPIGLILVWMTFKKGVLKSDKAQPINFWLIWVSFWVISLIPWGYAEVYYLLPFSFGTALIIGLLSSKIIALIKNYHRRVRLTTSSLVILAITLFATTLPTYRTHAKAQLAIDNANHQMLIFVKDNTPENGSVFIGLETEKEYVQNIEVFLTEHYGRKDISYDYVSVETLERLHWYHDGILILPFVENLPNLLPRTGVDENFTMTWVKIIMRTMDWRVTEQQTFHNTFKLSNLNLPVIACPIKGDSGYCTMPDPLLDFRPFTYGWSIYKIK